MDFFGAQTPSYDTNMRPKIVFVKFKISNKWNKTLMKQIQNNQKIHRKIYTSLWILKILRKNQRTKSVENFVKSLWFPIKKSVG